MSDEKDESTLQRDPSGMLADVDANEEQLREFIRENWIKRREPSLYELLIDDKAKLKR